MYFSLLPRMSSSGGSFVPAGVFSHPSGVRVSARSVDDAAGAGTAGPFAGASGSGSVGAVRRPGMVRGRSPVSIAVVGSSSVIEFFLARRSITSPSTPGEVTAIGTADGMR